MLETILMASNTDVTLICDENNTYKVFEFSEIVNDASFN